MDGPTYGPKDKLTDGPMNLMDGTMDGTTDELMDGLMDELKNWKVEKTNRPIGNHQTEHRCTNQIR